MNETLDAIEANWASMLWPPYGARAEVAYLLDLARKQQAAIDAVRAIATDLSKEAHRLYAAADKEKSPEFQHRARSRAQYLEGTSLDIRAALDPKP